MRFEVAFIVGIDPHARRLAAEDHLAVAVTNFALDVGNESLMDLGVDHHALQVRDAHQLLTLAHGLALRHHGLLGAKAASGLLRDVVDHKPILRGEDFAFLDFFLQILLLGRFLIEHRSLCVPVALGR